MTIKGCSAAFVTMRPCYRCNNVLYIRGVEEEDEEGEMKD